MSTTKAEVLKSFRAEIAPIVRKTFGRGDVVAMREAWNDYTDMLRADRIISASQYNNWSNPY